MKWLDFVTQLGRGQCCCVTGIFLMVLDGLYCQRVSLHGCRAAWGLAHIFQFGAKDNWVQELRGVCLA